MTDRFLTITLEPDWQGALLTAPKLAEADAYQGGVPNFETLAQFFGQLTVRRWDIVRMAQGKGTLLVRELARLVLLHFLEYRHGIECRLTRST